MAVIPASTYAASRLAGLGPCLIDMHPHAIYPGLPDLTAYPGSFASVRRVSANRAQIFRTYREVTSGAGVGRQD